MIQQLDCNKIKQAVLLNLMKKLKTNKELAFETDDNGNTWLHIAAQYEGTDNLIMTLVRYGINLKAKNAQGNTPLHIAAYHSPHNARLLMQLGAKDNVINNDALLPEDIFHQTFPEKCWFDIMPKPQVIFKGNRYYPITNQQVFEKA